MKKVIAIILSIIMTLSVFGTSVSAQEASVQSDIRTDERINVRDAVETAAYNVKTGFEILCSIMGGIHELVDILMNLFDQECPLCILLNGDFDSDRNPSNPTDPETPETPSEPEEPEVPDEPDVPDEPEDASIILSSNKKDLYVSDEEEEMFFYAETALGVPSISLYMNNEIIANMYDDGDFQGTGDDIEGDGVYSCRVYVEKEQEGSVEFFASVDEIVSNALSIEIHLSLTSEDVEKMDTTDEVIIENIFSVDGYADMTDEEKFDLANDELNKLADDGYIQKESLLYDETTMTYTFLYECGVLGYITLKEDGSDEYNSGAASNNSAVSEVMMTNSEVDSSEQIGDALVLWAFENTDFRVDFYNELKSDWDALGLSTTIDWNATVADYKNLSDYEVVVFAGHGTLLTFTINDQEVDIPAIVLKELVTEEKDALYAEDLTNMSICRCISKEEETIITKYAILPNFFTSNYEDSGLDGSFVFSETCEFRGNNGNVDSAFPNAILGASAEAVVGFHNSVLAVYSRDFMKDYVEELVDGATAKEAFDEAVSINGATDGDQAYPIFSGEESALLVSDGIKNGDFEDAAYPAKWNATGDTRVIYKLSDLAPQSGSKMAIITTGIGSGENSYLEGTEGSIIQQTFRVSSDNCNLAFTYNVVSEEPMEYVGSQYDDTFEAELLDKNGNVIQVLAKETVNSSTWYSISGINFDGGDSSTYHTGWKNIAFDVSEYIGESVTVRFKVYDKGDSIYDTAVLIDSVSSLSAMN